MIAKLLLQNTFFVVAFAALLFGSAGSLDWAAAWVFLIVSATLGPACGLWLASTDPALCSRPPSSVFFLLFAVRTRIEERALAEGLPDYADYAARVRYRLVPGLW